MVLRCPNYPGWSAYCKDVKLAVDCEEQVSLGFGVWGGGGAWEDIGPKIWIRMDMMDLE